MNHRIIYVKPVGNPAFPRWIICDASGEYWNGTSWVPNEARALLYADPILICNESARLQREETARKKCVSTVAVTINVEAFSDKPIDPVVLQEWLQRCLSLGIDMSNGSGPTPDSIVLSTLDWPSFRSVKAEVR